MKIVLLESLGISSEMLQSHVAHLLEKGHTFEAYERDTDVETQIARTQDADVIMLANMPLNGQVIRAAKNLKFIDVAFTGVDHIDLEAAREKKISVSNAAGYSTQAVAELAISLMLSLLRHVPQVDARCRAGQTKDGLVGKELGSQTVGIVGTGAIGLRTAQLLRAFGSRVLAYAPREKEAAKGLVTYVPLQTLLAESDIVSLHCPLNDTTRNLINAERIGQMKPGALLINVARGAVVDSAALAQALNSGKLAGAGIDVFETEPPLSPDHPLLHTPKTIVTPHVAFASEQSMIARANIVFENLDSWMAGKQKNCIL